MKWRYIAEKDIKILLKDPSALVTLLLLPLMFITVMSFALKDQLGTNDNPTVIGYIDKDKTEVSEGFLKEVGAAKGIKLEKIGTEKEFTKQKEEGNYVVLLEVPKGFQEKVEENAAIEVPLFSDATQATTANILIQSIQGLSRAFEIRYQLEAYGKKQGEWTSGLVNEAVSETVKGIEQNTGIDLSKLPKQETDEKEAVRQDIRTMMEKELDKSNIKVKNSFNNDQETPPDSVQQNTPGYAIMFAFFIVMFSGKSFLKEKESGTWKRLLISKAKPFDLYFGKFIPNYLINFCQIFFLFLFSHFVFKLSLGKDLFALLVMIAVLSLCSSSLGACLAFIAKTESQLTGFSMFIVLFSSALGGTMVPLSLMPDIMQKVAGIVPQSWALKGFQKIIVTNGGLADIVSNVVVLLLFSLVFLTGALFFIRNERK